MHQRFYSHDTGRFLSVDSVGGTVGKSQSWNRYSYVSNNPLSFVDPDGRSQRRVHVAHTRGVLASRGFSEVSANAAARSNIRSDRGFARIWTPNHATSLFLTDGASNRRGQRFAQRKLRGAIRAANRGNTRKAVRRLGKALHAAEDVVAHDGLGNVSVTVLQGAFGDGDRFRTHAERDGSLDVTETESPMDGVVTGIAEPAIHEEIVAGMEAVVDEFLEGIEDPQIRDAILEGDLE